jgi:hypothetical protein
MEVSLLLPGWQVAALADAAGAQGLTAGQMVRRLIRDFFAHQQRTQRCDAEKLDVSAQW